MSDRDDRRARQGNEQQPVIPDGGLHSSMPAWLTERPRWADTPTREAPTPVRKLPPPDTSPIELSSILDVADLPSWLQDVARRVERRDAVLATPPKVADPQPEIVPDQDDVILEDVSGAQRQEAVRQPEPSPQVVVEEAGPVEPVPAIESCAEDEAETAELVTEVAEHEAATVAEADRLEQEVTERQAAIADQEATASSGGLGGERPAKGQPVDWAAVRREAAIPTESKSAQASSTLLSQNPPVRVDPMSAVRERSSRSQGGQDRPWWMSDTAIGVLFVAVILTMIYVILVASGVL